MSGPKHFLDLDRLDKETLRGILDQGSSYKKDGSPVRGLLSDRVLALIFEKPSTRTRVSFDVAMRQLGGQTLFLSEGDSQLGRGETIADTARVLSRYVDAIMIRTDDPNKLEELAEHATVPVINGLTDRTHPCQLMADVMTFEEHRGPIRGRTVAWVGDGNNVAASWIQAATQFDFELRLGCPPELQPAPEIMSWAENHGGKISLTTDAAEAVGGADCVVADTWVSMGDKEAENR
ncbi:MAG: ornithine carbamoyltransferase, partial [Pseudomonadota bacterium]